MGGDKALLDLGGTTAVERLAAEIRSAGIHELLVVRAAGAAALPSAAGLATVTTGPGEMRDSLRAGLRALSGRCTEVVVCPVDHALVAADTFAAVAARVAGGGAAIALPLFQGRPGHPIALARTVLAELDDPAVTMLRDIVRKDPARVAAVPTANPWVLADLDRPEDLRAARAALHAGPWPVVEQMHRHRSRRAYAPTPLADGQLERLVDAARRASTSSHIQAYAVVAVRDPARREQVARLCADQEHIRQAPVFLAICADLHKIDVACHRRGHGVQADSLELFLQATVDAALLGQNIQLAAESEGLGACMIGAARNNPIALAELLGLPRPAFVVFGITVGHAVDDPLPRDRMPLTGVLHEEVYDRTRIDAVLAEADAGTREWARLVNARQGGWHGRPIDEQKGWSDRMAVLGGPDGRYLRARATLRGELQQLGFGLR
jgi:nitroreductase/CTP:molybdopterin cytidylyltransferase MocA